jgi:hypothetical protein
MNTFFGLLSDCFTLSYIHAEHALRFHHRSIIIVYFSTQQHKIRNFLISLLLLCYEYELGGYIGDGHS